MSYYLTPDHPMISAINVDLLNSVEYLQQYALLSKQLATTEESAGGIVWTEERVRYFLCQLAEEIVLDYSSLERSEAKEGHTFIVMVAFKPFLDLFEGKEGEKLSELLNRLKKHGNANKSLYALAKRCIQAVYVKKEAGQHYWGEIAH